MWLDRASADSPVRMVYVHRISSFMYTKCYPAPMKTHVEVDDDLLQEVLRLGAFETKKAAINAALVELSKSLKRRELLALRGKVRWHGDLDQLRTARDRSAGGAG